MGKEKWDRAFEGVNLFDPPEVLRTLAALYEDEAILAGSATFRLMDGTTTNPSLIYDFKKEATTGDARKMLSLLINDRFEGFESMLVDTKLAAAKVRKQNVEVVETKLAATAERARKAYFAVWHEEWGKEDG